MQRAMLVTMLILGFFFDVDAKEPEAAGTIGKPERQNGFATYAGAAVPDVSEVRVYGILDLNVTRAKEGKHPSDSTITSGIWKGSRLGLRGNKDLGAGLDIIFHLESGFGTSDGKLKLQQAGRLFGRQGYVGLASRLGAVTFGHQYAASDALAAMIDIAVPGTILSTYKSQFYWNIDRLDDALLYSSPEIGGFQASIGYAFGGDDAGGDSTTTVGLLYNAGAFTAGVSWDSWRTSDVGTPAGDYDFRNVAASYDLGGMVLVAGFSADGVNLDLSSTTAVGSNTYALGAKLPAGAAGKIILLSQVIKPENATAMMITSLGYSHMLTKRTALYGQINVANNPAAKVYGLKSEFIIGLDYRFNVPLWGNQLLRP